MTLIESIYEIKSAVLDLQKYLTSKDAAVTKKAKAEYLKLIDKFFRENGSIIIPQQRDSCVHDLDYFLRLMESAVEHYYTEAEK
jgi:hypothetical protein